MPTHRASLLLIAAGFALLTAGSAHADAALETPIATAHTTQVDWIVQPEPETVARQYPERFERTRGGNRCSGEFTIGAQKGYLYRHHGLDVANGEPTSQTTVTGTCGDFSVEVGGSVLLTDGRDGIPAGMEHHTATGTGSERLANEAWVILSYHPSIDTIVGRFNLTGAVIYRANDHTQGVLAIRDDYTELFGQIGYPITFGNLTIEPFFRSIKANPVGYANSLYWFGEGVKIDWLYKRGFSFHFTFAYDHNVNSVTAVVHRNVWYGSVGFRKDLPFRGWSLEAEVQFSQYGNYDRNFDFIVERDGRLLKSRSLGQSESGLEFYPRARLRKVF